MYRRPRRRPYIGWLAALLAVAVVAGLVYGLVRVLGAAPDLDKTAILLPTPDPEGVFPWEDGVLCIRGPQPTIICCDLKGTSLWPTPTPLPANNMKAARFGDMTTVWGDKQVLVLDEQGIVKWRLPTAGDVVIASPGVNYYAVVTKEENQHRLRLYSMKDGSQAQEILFPYEIVLGVGFFGDGNQLWVLSADSHGTQPVTKLRTYSPGKMQTQTGEITLNNEIGYSTVLSDKMIYIVGTHNLTTWEHSSDETDSKLVYGWTLLDSLVEDNGKIGFLFAPTGGSGQISALWYISTSGEQYRVPLPVGCFSAMLKDRGKICVASHNGIWSMAPNGSGSRFYPVGNGIDSIPAVVPGKALVVQQSHRNYLVAMP